MRGGAWPRGLGVEIKQLMRSGGCGDLPPGRSIETFPELRRSLVAETRTTTEAFRVNVPDEELAELRRRIAATRWPSGELVPDRSQGVQRGGLQGLPRYRTG